MNAPRMIAHMPNKGAYSEKKSLAKPNARAIDKTRLAACKRLRRRPAVS